LNAAKQLQQIQSSDSVAAICHKSWGVPGLRPPFHLRQSFFFLPSRGLPGGLCRARSPAAKHFDAIYAAKQRYKIHIDV